MFRRPRHRLVAELLACLDAELLAQQRCYFGGGTAIVLKNDEYRESFDVDFLVSDRDGYREVRRLVTGERGINALAKPGCELRARCVRCARISTVCGPLLRLAAKR